MSAPMSRTRVQSLSQGLQTDFNFLGAESQPLAQTDSTTHPYTRAGARVPVNTGTCAEPGPLLPAADNVRPAFATHSSPIIASPARVRHTQPRLQVVDLKGVLLCAHRPIQGADMAQGEVGGNVPREGWSARYERAPGYTRASQCVLGRIRVVILQRA